MEFRKYVKGDIFEILDKDAFAKFEVPFIEDIDPELTWTAIENTFVLGCGGFRRFWNGVYEAWLAARPDAMKEHKVETVKFIKRVFKELHAHRIQATIALDRSRPTNTRFLFYLGFCYEGTLQQYGPDKQDYNLYSITR